MVLEECKARGTVVCSRLEVPPGYKACKLILFTEGIPEVEIKNTCLMKLTCFILSHFAWLLLRSSKIFTFNF